MSVLPAITFHSNFFRFLIIYTTQSYFNPENNLSIQAKQAIRQRCFAWCALWSTSVMSHWHLVFVFVVHGVWNLSYSCTSSIYSSCHVSIWINRVDFSFCSPLLSSSVKSEQNTLERMFSSKNKWPLLKYNNLIIIIVFSVRLI